MILTSGILVQKVRICSKWLIGCRKDWTISARLCWHWYYSLTFMRSPIKQPICWYIVLLLWEAQLSSQYVDSRILEIQSTQPSVHEELAIGRNRTVIPREDMEIEFEFFQSWKIVAR